MLTITSLWTLYFLFIFCIALDICCSVLRLKCFKLWQAWIVLTATSLFELYFNFLGILLSLDGVNCSKRIIYTLYYRCLHFGSDVSVTIAICELDFTFLVLNTLINCFNLIIQAILFCLVYFVCFDNLFLCCWNFYKVS